MDNCFDLFYMHFVGDAAHPMGYYDCYYGGTNPQYVSCGNGTNSTLQMAAATPFRRHVRGSNFRGRNVIGSPDAGRAFNADKILQKMGIKAPGLAKRQNPGINYHSPNAGTRLVDYAVYEVRIIPSGATSVETLPPTTVPTTVSPSVVTSRITDLVTVTTTQTVTITTTLSTGGTTIITTIITTVCSTGTVVSGTTSWTSSTPASIPASATMSASQSGVATGSGTALPASNTASACPTDPITSIETVWTTPTQTVVPRMFRRIAI
ncbi:uncharacterized protein BKA78DRAFT_314196, partial [Phyllosticta capitalensis]